MESYKYVIIGGGLAGQRAGDGIRKVDTDGTVALVTGEHHMPYQRPPLSKSYLTGEEGLDHVYLREDAYYAQNNIKVIIWGYSHSFSSSLDTTKVKGNTSVV